MKKIFSHINWKELFIPVITDIKAINEETDSTHVSNNNWSLANNNDNYEKIIGLIKEHKLSPNSDSNIIILE